jgi:plasmid stability protein
MRKTQVQLPEELYQRLRAKAFQERRSLSSVVRGLLEQCLTAPPTSPTLEAFTFIASGRSDQTGLAPVSERHDEALDFS